MKAIVLASLALVAAATIAIAQEPQGAPAAAQGPGRGAAGTRNFLGLGPPPDGALATKGEGLYSRNCAFCHGPTARGAEGPGLIYSELVLRDYDRKDVVEFLKSGRPDKGMPSFAGLSELERRQVSEFLQLKVEEYANRGTYKVLNILVGDPQKGRADFERKCASCHSPVGDLKGIGARYAPADLQRNWISPPRGGAAGKRALRVTVSTREGMISGRLAEIDDFRVVVFEGDTDRKRVVVRSKNVDVKVEDILAPHYAMIPTLVDSDMHNMTAYLETLK